MGGVLGLKIRRTRTSLFIALQSVSSLPLLLFTSRRVVFAIGVFTEG
jgi:hypothetical protein